MSSASTKSPRKEVSVSEKFAQKRLAWARRPEILKNHHRLILGDARKLLGFLPAGTTVDLVVTSPPYWDLKRYEDDHGGAQLGHLHERKQFLAALDEVWRQSFELLEPGGRLVVVVGDVCRSRRQFGRHSVDPLHAYIQVHCQALAFDPLAPIIWKKIANLSTEAARNGSTFLGKPYEPNAIVKNDLEHILIFRKPGGYRHPTEEQRALSVLSKEDHRRFFEQVWTDLPGEPKRHHPAPFPLELARRLIAMFSFVGDTVLDPFSGIGTTTRAAIELHRASIAVEIEPEYWKKARLLIGEPPEHATVEFVTSEPTASPQAPGEALLPAALSQTDGIMRSSN